MTRFSFNGRHATPSDEPICDGPNPFPSRLRPEVLFDSHATGEVSGHVVIATSPFGTVMAVTAALGGGEETSGVLKTLPRSERF